MLPNVSVRSPQPLGTTKRRERYNYRPLNNLIGEMIDTTITRNQNRVGPIRPPRAASQGAAVRGAAGRQDPTIAHRRFNQLSAPNGFLSSLNCNNGHFLSSRCTLGVVVA